MKRLLLSFLVLAAACGDDGKPGGGDERRLSELSTTEARDLCEQLLADVPDAEWRGVARLGCAFLEAVNPDGCMTSNIDTCADQALAQIKADPAQCDEISDNQGELAACTVTVAELGACLDDLLQVFADLGDSLTCENFGTADLTPDVPASCQRLKSACPGVVDFETH